MKLLDAPSAVSKVQQRCWEWVDVDASHEDQPGLTSQVQNKYSFSVYLDNKFKIWEQGVSWILKQLYKSLHNPSVESIWRHFPTAVLVSIPLAASANFIYIACLRHSRVVHCPHPQSSQLSLFGMAAHQGSRVWEEISEANRTELCQFSAQMRDWISVWERWQWWTEVGDNSDVLRNHRTWWRKLSLCLVREIMFPFLHDNVLMHKASSTRKWLSQVIVGNLAMRGFIM